MKSLLNLISAKAAALTHHPLFHPFQPQVGNEEQRAEGAAAAAQEALSRHAVPGLL